MTEPEIRIKAAIDEIQGWLSQIPVPGEAIVRQAIILRLLDAAGFDIWNPLEVVPEETNATGNRSDFLVRAGEGKFALEIKGMNVTLQQNHYQQAATYAVNEGTRWAIVTNGRIWVVIDEHMQGRWDERVALKLELGQDEFADDLALLLNQRAWIDDLFPSALGQIKERQKWRHNAEKTRKEKMPVIEEVQRKFKIPSFELAIDAAVEMHRITESEANILRGVSIIWEPYIDFLTLTPDELDAEISIGYRSNSDNSQFGLPSSLGFSYKTKGAEARVRWETRSGVWIIRKGSTALDRLPAGDEFMREMRERLIREGAIKRLEHGLLEYVNDVEYSSASMAASHIAGGSRNGWDCWKDQSGRPASIYRKSD